MTVVHSYTQFYDVETKTDGFSMFTVSAGGPDVKKRLAPFFGAYKNYKLGEVKVKCVPAATLPVDPTGLSTAVGDQTVDPRDMFNPGLVRITNGESIGTVSNVLGVPGDMNQYYAMMLDPRWYKFRLQEGFSRSAVPLVYNIAESRQDALPGNVMGVHNGSTVDPHIPVYQNGDPQTAVLTRIEGQSVDMRDYFRSRILLQSEQVRLGWMPTDDYLITDPVDGHHIVGSAPIPEVDLITFIFPKAFKTKFYYRIFIETTVMFKDPVVIDPIEGGLVVPTDRYVYSPLLTYKPPIRETDDSGFDFQG